MVMDLSTIPKSLTSHLPEEQQFVLALFIQDKDHQLQIKELQHQLKMQNLEKKLVQLFREDPATIWSVTITTSPTTTNPLFLPLRTTVGPTMIPRDLEALPATLGGSSTQRKMASRELVVRLTATPLFPKSVGLVSPLPPSPPPIMAIEEIPFPLASPILPVVVVPPVMIPVPQWKS